MAISSVVTFLYLSTTNILKIVFSIIIISIIYTLFFAPNYIARWHSPFSTKNVYDTMNPDRKPTHTAGVTESNFILTVFSPPGVIKYHRKGWDHLISGQVRPPEQTIPSDKSLHSVQFKWYCISCGDWCMETLALQHFLNGWKI